MTTKTQRPPVRNPRVDERLVDQTPTAAEPAIAPELAELYAGDTDPMLAMRRHARVMQMAHGY